MSAPRILVVEDEPKIAALLRDYLIAAGFVAELHARGDAVVASVRSNPPAAILLDLMLPGMDGLTVCRALRAFSEVPVIMLTARVDEIDRLLGLELGADDYVCKPFSPREVIARLRAVLRRARDRPSATQPAPGLILDDERFEARLDGAPVDLTPVEFRLLRALVQRPGRVLSRAQLQDVIYADHRVVSDRTVDSHIKNLRRKLAERRPGSELVHSVYGVGYRFEAPGD
jgi:two-component system response regulator BaeR